MQKFNALTHDQLRSLIELFLDGGTSPGQEQALYRAFATAPVGSLPDDLEAHRPMLAWFDNYSSPAAQPKKISFFRRYTIAGIACTLAIMIGVGLFFAKSDAANANPLIAQYSGSYMIENGQKISDINKIYSKILEAERLTDSLETVAANQEDILLADYDVQLVESTLSNVADRELAALLKNELLGETSAKN